MWISGDVDRVALIVEQQVSSFILVDWSSIGSVTMASASTFSSVYIIISMKLCAVDRGVISLSVPIEVILIYIHHVLDFHLGFDDDLLHRVEVIVYPVVVRGVKL